jgi:Polyketide cyclase / dehydrase and lipid transport
MGGVVQKSFLGAIALFALLLSPAAWASRQKITDSIEINAPPAKVWAGIADVHDMSWHSGVTKTTGEGGNEPDVANAG